MLNQVARHESARPFSIKAEEFVLTLVQVFKNRRDDSRVNAFGIQRIEILVRRQVNENPIAMILEVVVDRVRDRRAPEIIEASSPVDLKSGSHF